MLPKASFSGEPGGGNFFFRFGSSYLRVFISFSSLKKSFLVGLLTAFGVQACGDSL